MTNFNFSKQFIERHFFFAADARSLNLFRAVFCLIILWRIITDAPPLHENYNTVAWHAVPTFEWLEINQLSAETFKLWEVVLVTALAMTSLGMFTRVAAATACAAYFIYIGNYLGFTKCEGTNYVYHSKNIVVFILFIFAVAPGINIWGFDGWLKRGCKWLTDSSHVVSVWPTQLIKLMLGIAYFGAGYGKIAASPGWADGYTLQAYLVQKYLLIDKFNSLWLSQFWWVCLTLGVATLIFELTFFIIVFKPRLTWFYVLAGLGFHVSILLSMEINFFPYFGATYLIFFEWKMLQRLCSVSAHLKKIVGSPAERFATQMQPIGNTRMAFALILAFWIVGDACVLFKIEAWPFSDYGVFRKRNSLASVSAIRMGGITPEGKMVFLERDEYPMGERLGWWINYSRMRRYMNHPELQDDTFRSVTNYVRAKKPGKYVAIVAVNRSVEGVPGEASFKVNDDIVMEQMLGAADAAPGPITRVATGELNRIVH
jgi:hypothetical protein